MLHKWKSILINWIKCYSDKCMKNEDHLNLESLQTVISHLHENLNLDESKSSILEAQTVEEFLIEKYPEFKFENGTVELIGQEEVYLAASVLLYFVCVNSKDVDIKSAMCSKLCTEDQEIILKFTKRLLEWSPITCGDVQTAIIEACGEHRTSIENLARPKVSETPPALRSLHGEVRRLQAALDAERFDRNYLQEELARTNLKVEKLIKDREQCKLEIVCLKAKLSSAGQEVDDRSANGGGEGPIRLAKQLEDLEERLVATQEQLEEMLYERDTYKTKVTELKQERDKWVSVSQIETSKACQLAEDLETERATSHGLRELVNELRQHNQRNHMDVSQLECDDADASAISLQNASVCSEACANIVEVQLSEEKAKVLALKEKIQALQVQLNDVIEKALTEKRTFEELLLERDNEINELEQNLKDNTESSRQMINQQQQEIQTLQEEKLSLIQSLSDESTKLENMISALRNELDTEKIHKQNMKDDYENQMMKLKEKVLNRNNELVELQNNICQKSEMIEKLHLDLRSEKQNKEKLIEKNNNVVSQLDEQIKRIEHELKQKTDEANELQKRLSQNVAIFTEINREIDDLKLANEELQKNCKCLSDAKASLTAQLRERTTKLDEMEKLTEDMKNQHEEEKNNLLYELDEKVAMVNTLQMQLHAEIQYKSGLENELCHLRQARSSLSDEVNKLNAEIAVLKSENMEKERTIYALDLYLKEEKHSNKTTKEECDKLNQDIKNMSEDLVKKQAEIGDLVAEIKTLKTRIEFESKNAAQEAREKEKLIKTTHRELQSVNAQKEAMNSKLTSLVEVKEKEMKELANRLEFESENAAEAIRKRDELLKTIGSELQTVKAQKEALESKLTSLIEQKDKLAIDMSTRSDQLLLLEHNFMKLNHASEETIKAISNKLEVQAHKYLLLQKSFDEHTSQLMIKLSEKEKVFKDLYTKAINTIKQKEMQVETLKIKISALENIIRNERETLTTMEKEKRALIEQLDAEVNYKNNFEKEYQNQCSTLDKITSQMNSVIASKTEEIDTMKKEVDILKSNIALKTEANNIMTMKIAEETQAMEIFVNQKNSEVADLRKEIIQCNTLNTELEKELNKKVEAKMRVIEALQRENEQLHFTIEEDNSNHEVLVKEKDTIIESLEEHLKVMSTSLELLRKDYENVTYMSEKAKIENQELIKLRNDRIDLKQQIRNLNNSLYDAKESVVKLKQNLIEDIQITSKEIAVRFKKHDAVCIVELERLKIKIRDLEHENNNLKSELESEKGARDALESEKDKLIKINESLIEEQSAYTSIYGDKSELLNEKSILTHELMEERFFLELSKQKELYNTTLEAKDKQIHKLQAEKESLTIELNDVKFQLEVKVHSLKEKIVDNENVTDKLKNTYECQIENLNVMVTKLTNYLKEKTAEVDVAKKEKDRYQQMVNDSCRVAASSLDRVSSHRLDIEKERLQVSSPTSDLTHSSMESLKTISDLEKIILDKNRTITNLQSDITYMKSLVADSENKLLDVTKELDITKEHCEQLSCQLKKIVHLKNDEIADLKKQVAKMSVTETRASQIIKVSARYQAMILKRIAEIKSNTILKELTNFGNTANCDNELKRSLNSGSITMEDLENFLETTDRHLKRCSDKQTALQKERDRLIEVNRINESEIINLKKFLTELSVSFKTYSSVKDLYTQKLSRVVSLQRTVRREILNLDGHVKDVTMCKLERGYAAVIQDLAECAMNLERWVERCIGRTISPEKIKQAFSSDSEISSLGTTTFQNASLEVQLDELEKSFQKLLEEVMKAPKGEGARDPQAVTVMEVRAEYEDKLNRMKAKMKQLYQEQISVFKEKQKEEIAVIGHELEKAKDQLAESSRAYEEHIRSLTNELWNVGEKYLMKKDEAEWLRRKDKSGSLMSLQHVHSSGLTGVPDRPPRPSDTHSLRSLPVAARNQPSDKRENRGLHMSDEEGELFDNRYLHELMTPRPKREREVPPGARLSELQWRNSLCPPHLKSSYPAETQFSNTIDEDDIKAHAAGSRTSIRKEVGITAYKKPGPPTPSKQAGRLSATDCELRESVRGVDNSPAPSMPRKTSTPSRLRALFARQKHDDGTPRKRFSNIFGKK